MAGLLDFLGGDDQAPQGLLGRIGNAGANPLVLAGLGLAGGNGWGEGMQGAARGLLAYQQMQHAEKELRLKEEALREKPQYQVIEGPNGQEIVRLEPQRAPVIVTPPELRRDTSEFNRMFGGGGAPSGAPAALPKRTEAPSAGGSPYAGAISNIESGGKYDTLGPVTRDGDRAFGKYQVMGKNVGPWTKEVLGQELSPQQFLASPQAQDAVFNGKFGQYAQKYGPEGAARAWFAGEGGMNDMGRRDQLGTSVADYARKFNAGVDQQPRVRMAEGAGALPMTDAGPQARVAGLPTLPDSAAPSAPAGPQLAQNTPAAPSGPGGTIDPQAMARIDQYTRMLANAPKAYHDAIKARLDAELKAVDPTGTLKEYNAARAQGYKGSVEEWVTESDKRKQNQVNVNAFANPLVKGLSDQFLEDRTGARSALDEIRTIHTARGQVDQGILSGTGAPVQLGLAKLGAMFGVPNDKIANTETFNAAMGDSVLSMIKGLGQNPSNSDRDFANEIAGRKTTLDEKTIRRLLDFRENVARTRIEKYNAQADKFAKALPDEAKAYGALMGVDTPGEYVKPQAPAAAAAAPVPPQGTWTDPKTGKTYRVIDGKLYE